LQDENTRKVEKFSEKNSKIHFSVFSNQKIIVTADSNTG
jgi:hypothetical protein